MNFRSNKCTTIISIHVESHYVLSNTPLKLKTKCFLSSADTTVPTGGAQHWTVCETSSLHEELGSHGLDSCVHSQFRSCQHSSLLRIRPPPQPLSSFGPSKTWQGKNKQTLLMSQISHITSHARTRSSSEDTHININRNTDYKLDSTPYTCIIYLKWKYFVCSHSLYNWLFDD